VDGGIIGVKTQQDIVHVLPVGGEQDHIADKEFLGIGVDVSILYSGKWICSFWEINRSSNWKLCLLHTFASVAISKVTVLNGWSCWPNCLVKIMVNMLFFGVRN